MPPHHPFLPPPTAPTRHLLAAHTARYGGLRCVWLRHCAPALELLPPTRHHDALIPRTLNPAPPQRTCHRTELCANKQRRRCTAVFASDFPLPRAHLDRSILAVRLTVRATIGLKTLSVWRCFHACYAAHFAFTYSRSCRNYTSYALPTAIAPHLTAGTVAACTVGHLPDTRLRHQLDYTATACDTLSLRFAWLPGGRCLLPFKLWTR